MTASPARAGASWARCEGGPAVAASRTGFAALALAVFVACGLWATWPAVRHADGHYLARPAPGYGEVAAGDHLQLAWALWLPGHQLGRGAAPWVDPYSFQPVAAAPPNLQGWLLGGPYWPLDRLLGPVWAYDVLLLLTFVAAGAFTTGWLAALLPRLTGRTARGAALVGGVAFALAPYRVAQSTGHLLGMISFLLPAMLLALERRRVGWATAVLVAIPLSGQLHLALGAIPLFLGYTWARSARELWPRAGVGALLAAAVGLLVQREVIDGSIAAGGHSLASVMQYSAEVSDFVTRGVGAGIEELVFVGWFVPLLALAGLAVLIREQQHRVAWCLGAAALLPCLLALGTNLHGYEWLWEHVAPFRYPRVPERLLPIACLALAALTALAVHQLVTLCHKRWCAPALAAGAVVLLALDLRVPVFGALPADRGNHAYAAIRGEGRLLELPVFRPDLHFGSTYLAYVQRSPRERPQGYSTLAPPAADGWARANRGLSCGRGEIPDGIAWVAVHRGLYAQSGFFGDDCPAGAERLLRASGWTLAAHEGEISIWQRAARRPEPSE